MSALLDIFDATAPVKCLKAHDVAMAAKWGALLIGRLKDVDIDLQRSNLLVVQQGGLSLREIMARMRRVCYSNTPDATFVNAGAHIGTNRILNLSSLVHTAYAHAYQHDKSFDWYGAFQIIMALNIPFQADLSKEAFAPFDFTWQEREELRLAAGVYLPLPWASKLTAVAGHYAHLSVKQRGLIAYTEDGEKGERDIQKQIKPGKYLKEFYPAMGNEQIEELQAMVIGNEVLKITQDPDVIEKLYVEGPESCMSGDKSRWASYVSGHPARLYGNGDLAIAYLTDKKGRCNARVVCWPDKKVYNRIYGDYQRLEKRLEEAGYREGANWCFQGAKVRKHPNAKVPGTVLATSFDGHGNFSFCKDDNDFLVVDRNGPLSYSGNGYMVVPTPVPCACGCGKQGLSNLMIAILNKDGQSEKWIPACRDAAYRAKRLAYCAASGHYGDPSLMVEVYWVSRDTRVTVMPVWRQSGCLRSASGNWYRIGAFRWVSLPDGTLWEEQDLRRAGTHRQNPKTNMWEPIVKEEQAKQAA